MVRMVVAAAEEGGCCCYGGSRESASRFSSVLHFLVEVDGFLVRWVSIAVVEALPLGPNAGVDDEIDPKSISSRNPALLTVLSPKNCGQHVVWGWRTCFRMRLITWDLLWLWL